MGYIDILVNESLLFIFRWCLCYIKERCSIFKVISVISRIRIFFVCSFIIIYFMLRGISWGYKILYEVWYYFFLYVFYDILRFSYLLRYLWVLFEIVIVFEDEFFF